MKKRNFFKLMVLSAALIFTSCLKYNEVSNPEEDAAAKFTFSTTKTIQLSVDVNDTYNNEFYYNVSVFDRDPSNTDTIAKALVSGVAKGNSLFNTELVIPQHISHIYVQQTDPLKRTTLKIVEIDSLSNTISCSFKRSTSVASSVKAMQKVVAPSPKATNYTLPATYTTINSAAITLDGINYLLPAGVTSSSVDFGWKQNSVLYVAGELTINTKKYYIPSYCKIIVLPGGKVNFNQEVNIEQTGAVLAVHPGASVVFNQKGSVGQGSLLVNDGTTTMNANFEIRSNSGLVNNGSMFGTQLTQTNNSTFTNNANVTLYADFKMNSQSEFINNGVFNVTASIITNNTTAVIKNYNTISVSHLNMVNGGGELINYCKVVCGDISLGGADITSTAGTSISCNNLYVNNSSIELKGNAIFKTSANTGIVNTYAPIHSGVTFNYGALIKGISEGDDYPLFIVNELNNRNGWKVLQLTGDLEYALARGQSAGINYYKGCGSGVSIVEVPTVTIAGTSCNNGGINSDPGTGTPTNPTFPITVEEDNQYTFAMEDLWPNLGDYDMNDFVFSIHTITKQIDQNNKVVSMSFVLSPKASGSMKEISAAVQFDKINASNISLTTTYPNSTKESDQTLANFVLFPKVHTLFGKSSPGITNTRTIDPKVTAESHTFTFTFASPVENSDVIISSLNFYAIVGEINSTDRKEIHLAGYKASSKVQKEINNYKDSNNMVWAIMLPVGDFKFPSENKKIYEAYPTFNSWAKSAGELNSDWYLHPSTTQGLVY